jgi:hypothetical protein
MKCITGDQLNCGRFRSGYLVYYVLEIVYMRMDETVHYTFYIFLTCTYIVCSVRAILTFTQIPDDDLRWDRNMLD